MTSFLLGKRAGALEDHTNPEQANNEADVKASNTREIVEEDATNALKQENQESKETRDTTNNGTGTEASADLLGDETLQQGNIQSSHEKGNREGTRRKQREGNRS